MPEVFDLNNVFVYYFTQVASPPVVNRDRDFNRELDTSGVTLALAGGVTYDPPLSRLNGRLEVLDSASFENSTSAMQSSVFRHSTTRTATVSTTVTEGIKVGAQTKLTTGIPFFAMGEIQLSAEASLSSTQSFSSSETQTFAVDTPINVPPRSRVEATLMISSQEYRGTLMADVLVGGRVRLNLGNSSRAVEVSDLFNAIRKSKPKNTGLNLTDHAGTSFMLEIGFLDRFRKASQGVLYSATATVEAKFGANQVIRLREFNLKTGKMVKEVTRKA